MSDKSKGPTHGTIISLLKVGREVRDEKGTINGVLALRSWKRRIRTCKEGLEDEL